MDTVLARLRADAAVIYRQAITAVNPETAIRAHVKLQGLKLTCAGRTFDLQQYERIYLLGAGKAAAAMAAAMEKILGSRLAAGLVIVKYGHLALVDKTVIVEAGHPVPDEAGVAGSRRLLELAREAGPRDLVIALISGGGSALMPLPAAGLTLADKQATTRELLACGAEISEINTIRKHLSAIKGGQLARSIAPATTVTLVISDVIGDPLESIASGPTVPDPTTYQQCLEIVARYRLEERLPAAVLAHLRRGAAGKEPETPKPGDPLFARVSNHIIASNRQAVDAAARQAAARGYRPLILATTIEGETRDVARLHGAIAREIHQSGNPAPPPVCVISGGETTVTIRGPGLGGRNQEFVLAAAREIAGLPATVIVSLGTDGTDGPTDAAGAVADGQTVARARELGLDPAKYLADNDAYHFFAPLDDLIITGPTNTNVMDIHLLLAGRE